MRDDYDQSPRGGGARRPEFADDWDQKPDDEPEVAALGSEVYDTGAINALRAILAALDAGASLEDIRAICEKGIAALTEKKGERE